MNTCTLRGHTSARCLRRPATVARAPPAKHFQTLCNSSTAESSNITAKQQLTPLPNGPSPQVQQAATAVEAAWRAGQRLQRLELLLPLIGATDLDDWPGGIRQQFKAAQPMVESILKSLKSLEGLQGPLPAEIWDQADAVAAWKGEKLAAVLFPTASTLDNLRKLAEGPNPPSLVLIINPQWELKGNLLNDFGWGPWRQQKEDFVNQFKSTYHLRKLRVYGDDVRVLYAYPGEWQIMVVDKKGGSQCVGTFAEQPSYQQIEDLLKSKPDSSVNKTWLQRLQEEYEFNKESLQQK